MNLRIDHLAISLQNVSPPLGGQVSDLLQGALARQLSALKLRATRGGLGDADLGVIDAPANADPLMLAELIATRLGEWIERAMPEPLGAPAPASASASAPEGR